MLMSQLKVVIAIVLVPGFMAIGAIVFACHAVAAQRDKPPIAEEPAATTQKQGQEREESFTSWGKEMGGLQAGLGYHPGQKRAYSHGETVRLVVRIRNVGKEGVKFQYLGKFFVETPPTVTDAEGKPVPCGDSLDAMGIHVPKEVNLAPRKEVELYELRLRPRPASEVDLRPSHEVGPEGLVEMLWASGKVYVQYERVFGNSSSGPIKLAPDLSKLATGRLELEINPALPEKK